MKRLFALRRSSMIWTDKRAKLLQELLGGMKIIKYFAWEVPFLERVEGYRHNEMTYVKLAVVRSIYWNFFFTRFIRSLLLIRSAMNAVGMSMPTLASVLAFVTYSATGHSLEPGVIFASLTLFNLLRLPLMFLRAFIPGDVILTLIAVYSCIAQLNRGRGKCDSPSLRRLRGGTPRNDPYN